VVPFAAMLAQYQKTTRCNMAPGFIFGTSKDVQRLLREKGAHKVFVELY
jgi:hypothetical protein